MNMLEAKIKNYFSEKNAPFKEVLDIGCGTKPYKKYIRCERYVGIDVEISGRTEKYADVYYDGENIPFENNTFDLVMCTQVLEHVKDDRKILSEVFRVLKPGGEFLLTVPFIWGEHETPYDFRRFTSFGILKSIQESGLECVYFEKIETGFSCLGKFMSSELQHSIRRENAIGYIRHYLAQKMVRILGILLRGVEFPRIYLDNFVVAKKGKVE